MFTVDDQKFQELMDAEDPSYLFSEFPCYPLTAPGMPLPGPDFVAEAQRRDDAAPEIEGAGSDKHMVRCGKFLTYLYLRALYDPHFALPISVKGSLVQSQFVPGHLWGYIADGPRPASVMIIGKWPGREELERGRNFVGPSTTQLTRALAAVNITPAEYEEWYVTNVCRFVNPNPASNTLPQQYLKDCGILLHQELRLVQPDYILCLGSDASKYLLGKRYGVEAMKGRIVDYQIPLHHDVSEEPQYKTAKVMTAVHPAMVHREPSMFDELEMAMTHFRQLIRGETVDRTEYDLEHHVVFNARHLEQLVDRVINDPDPASNVIAVDAEWQGDQPWEPGSYLRTVQFSHKGKFAACVVLRHAGGEPAFQPGIGAAIRELKRLLLRDEVRLGGHFFRADLPWLIHLFGEEDGTRLRHMYAPAETPEACRERGGWDTSLIFHALFETGRRKLEELAVRHTTCPRWDVALADWKKSYCSKRGIKDSELEGYGECPDDVLYPYAAYDADATRRLFDVGTRLLDSDYYGNNCWRPYWINHSASLAVLEMEETGLPVDMERAEELIHMFSESAQHLIEDMRAMFNWPNFNPQSPPHCRAVLFGDRYATRKDPRTGEPVPVRPPGARTLGLEPVVASGKNPVPWSRVREQGEEHLYNPGTDKQTLGVLGQQSREVLRLRDTRFIQQVLKTTLKPPAVDKQGFARRDSEGRKIFEKGVLSHVAADGRIHTHIRQDLETGRSASSRPNLQNISKRREDDYRRILGEHYTHSIRTIFRAPPGCVLIEADFTGAELAAIMWMSQDPTGIEHVRRNMLPEDHPDHYDMHSNAAVEAFHLTCLPTKTGMKDANCSGLRVAAKNVNFGIPYQRGARALAMQCREEGHDISEDDAKRLIDNYFNKYPRTYDFLEACKGRVINPRWMSSAEGRIRRFEYSDDEGVVKGMQREACNFPIQSWVADAMWRALTNLYYYRDECPDVLYWIALQIHDAALLVVPYEHVPRVMDDVLPTCMVDRVPVRPTDLNGIPLPGVETYRFGIDKEIGLRWGESLDAEQAVSLGIPRDYV